MNKEQLSFNIDKVHTAKISIDVAYIENEVNYQYQVIRLYK